MPHVALISPPFLSHARPMAVLGSALRKAGAAVSFVCAAPFSFLAERCGLDFYALSTTENQNTGVATATRQSRHDRERLVEFLESTRHGAVPALRTQTLHRQADMLGQPHRILSEVQRLHRSRKADWYVVDQLNYAVTLAMHCLGLTYASYIPGHPSYLIEEDDQYFGLPREWPAGLAPTAEDLAELRALVQETDRQFTELFNEVIAGAGKDVPPVPRAFSLASRRAKVFNYPPALAGKQDDSLSVYLGHCVEPAPLPVEWEERLAGTAGRTRVLVSLGTFFSARDDVLRSVISGVRMACSDAMVIVAAGESVQHLIDLRGESIVIESVVPQQELLPYMDLVVHHGGNNSFTECVYHRVPALILPFASDQFVVAHDAVRAGVAECMSPNGARPGEVADRVRSLLGAGRGGLDVLARQVRARGPHWGAARLAELMAPVSPASP
ncbi:glycosyltransferase [Streptomyces jumonjinensis]|uniref:glycosyltransferase n=1 Tax=Streptomyces jumonjinensis TaxID=1945 RepID=UPI00379F8F4C